MSLMSPNPKVRLAVANWPDDAPRGAVTAFCKKHKVSRAWFYKVREIAMTQSPEAAMELKSTKPLNSPTKTSESMTNLLLATRASLESQGWDEGPLSVIAKLERQGVKPPSAVTVWRIFCRAGVVIPEPKKRPKSSYIYFNYANPNGCWQIDATEWLLADYTKVVIFQIIDDHSRLALASLVATGETSEAAIRVVKTAIERHGVPQKFLSDNGSALNPTRLGKRGALVEFLKSLGVEPMTGKPYKPTTQGKNERFHLTLHKYLQKQPRAATMAILQAQVDAFDLYYNTERAHQHHEGNTTPQEAWDATEKAASPVPPIHEEPPAQELKSTTRTVDQKGAVTVIGTTFQVGKEQNGRTVNILHNDTIIMFFDDHGTEIISHPIPAKGTHYVGNGKPRGVMDPTFRRGPKNKVSTKS